MEMPEHLINYFKLETMKNAEWILRVPDGDDDDDTPPPGGTPPEDE
jgi:hypothetical protein